MIFCLAGFGMWIMPVCKPHHLCRRPQPLFLPISYRKGLISTLQFSPAILDRPNFRPRNATNPCPALAATFLLIGFAARRSAARSERTSNGLPRLHGKRRLGHQRSVDGRKSGKRPAHLQTGQHHPCLGDLAQHCISDLPGGLAGAGGPVRTLVAVNLNTRRVANTIEPMGL
jgi:hypothetical protein